MSSEPAVYIVREVEMEKRRRLWNVLSLVVVRLGMTPLQVMDRLSSSCSALAPMSVGITG